MQEEQGFREDRDYLCQEQRREPHSCIDLKRMWGAIVAKNATDRDIQKRTKSSSSAKGARLSCHQFDASKPLVGPRCRNVHTRQSELVMGMDSRAKWIEVVGWRGSKDKGEVRNLDGTSPHIVAGCRRVLYHLQQHSFPILLPLLLSYNPS
jgi:hypothetical protein